MTIESSADPPRKISANSGSGFRLSLLGFRHPASGSEEKATYPRGWPSTWLRVEKMCEDNTLSQYQTKLGMLEAS